MSTYEHDEDQDQGILREIGVTAELTNTELSSAGLLAMEKDLEQYPKADVVRALNRCRRELTGRLTLSAVLERLQEIDGRPNADEAWATACCADDEYETVVWTAETAEAFHTARSLLESGDRIGARMAFRDAYTRIVREARENSIPVKWSASLGCDADRRRVALTRAVEKGRLPPSYATGLLPPPGDGRAIAGLLADTQTLRLVGQDERPSMTPDEVSEQIEKLKKILKESKK